MSRQYQLSISAIESCPQEWGESTLSCMHPSSRHIHIKRSVQGEQPCTTQLAFSNDVPYDQRSVRGLNAIKHAGTGCPFVLLPNSNVELLPSKRGMRVCGNPIAPQGLGCMHGNSTLHVPLLLLGHVYIY